MLMSREPIGLEIEERPSRKGRRRYRSRMERRVRDGVMAVMVVGRNAGGGEG